MVARIGRSFPSTSGSTRARPLERLVAGKRRMLFTDRRPPWVEKLVAAFLALAWATAIVTVLHSFWTLL